MIYENIKRGIFLSRPNRFIAHVEIDGKEQICHVKNTGRCKELLLPGVKVILCESDNPDRKTKYDLIAVYKGNSLINMDSQIPNWVAYEWLKEGNLFKDITLIKPECKYKNSRFDFYVETKKSKNFIEVKGVTLEEDGVAMFPDAPTERGVKHIKELTECKIEGYSAFVIIVIQMKGIKYFTPNVKTHKAFATALKEAKEAGVEIICLDCIVEENSIKADSLVEWKI